VATTGQVTMTCVSESAPTTSTSAVYGAVNTGRFNLGPVDFAETSFRNACDPNGSPYPVALRSATGLGAEWLAGVSETVGARACNACILVQAGNGRSLVVRVVTFGATQAPGDVDLSPSADAVLNSGYPREMTLARCPDAGGTLAFVFDPLSTPWWTRVSVVNPRVPIATVEVQSVTHPQFISLSQDATGAFIDDTGFGSGAFGIRITAVDGQQVLQSFSSVPTGVVTSNQQFQ